MDTGMKKKLRAARSTIDASTETKGRGTMNIPLRTPHLPVVVAVLLAAATLEVCLPGVSHAQAKGKVEIAGFGGYQFWGGLDVYEGELCITESANWGTSIGYHVQPEVRFEIMYINQPTELTITRHFSGTNDKLFDMTVHYIMVGAMYEVPTDGKVVPYGGVMLGATGFVPEGNVGDEWLFAFSLNGGAKVYLSDRVGFRGQLHLLMPIQWAGGSIFCGSGGCSAGVTGGTAIVQGAVTGGVFVEF
jgi:hypothetical protein